MLNLDAIARDVFMVCVLVVGVVGLVSPVTVMKVRDRLGKRSWDPQGPGALFVARYGLWIRLFGLYMVVCGVVFLGLAFARAYLPHT